MSGPCSALKNHVFVEMFLRLKFVDSKKSDKLVSEEEAGWPVEQGT